MTELKDQLSLLGRKTEYKQDYAPEVLEAFDNKHPEKDVYKRQGWWYDFRAGATSSIAKIAAVE